MQLPCMVLTVACGMSFHENDHNKHYFSLSHIRVRLWKWTVNEKTRNSR